MESGEVESEGASGGHDTTRPGAATGTGSEASSGGVATGDGADSDGSATDGGMGTGGPSGTSGASDSGMTGTTATTDPTATTAPVTGGTSMGPMPDPPGPTSDPGFPKACDPLYDENLLPKFELEFQGDWQRQLCSRGYVPAVFKYGAESAPAMVRNKGNTSYNCDKFQFVISFNETNPDGRFHGLRKIVLDAPSLNASYLRERLGFYIMRQFGVAASCVNNAELHVNGAYQGLYTNIERVDREFLERNFADPTGNLYDGDYELKTNESSMPDTSRIDTFVKTQDLASLFDIADVQQAVRAWAGEAVVPDPDSYWAGVEFNAYYYDHPTRGFTYLPYDMDRSFIRLDRSGDTTAYDPLRYEHPEWGREEHMRVVLEDPTWCELYVDQVRLARGVYDPTVLRGKIDAWAAQIADAARRDAAIGGDGRISIDDHLAEVADLKAFVGERAAYLDAWLAKSQCPVRF